MEKYTMYSYDALVVGTGAAGYNAACRIQKGGTKTVAIVTEGINTGTSRLRFIRFSSTRLSLPLVGFSIPFD